MQAKCKRGDLRTRKRLRDGNGERREGKDSFPNASIVRFINGFRGIYIVPWMSDVALCGVPAGKLLIENRMHVYSARELLARGDHGE